MGIKTAGLILGLVATGLASGCATTASAPTPKAPEISAVDKSFLRGIGSYDQNRDRVVTCEEWRAAAAAMFTSANKSGSGALSEEEFVTLAKTDRIFLTASTKYYDANGDKKVDRKEFVDRPNAAFTYADKNNDCRLTEDEMVIVRSLTAPPAPSAPRPSAIGNGQPKGSGGGY